MRSPSGSGFFDRPVTGVSVRTYRGLGGSGCRCSDPFCDDENEENEDSHSSSIHASQTRPHSFNKMAHGIART